MSTHALSLRIPADLYVRLKARAGVRERSIKGEVNVAIREHLDREEVIVVVSREGK